MSRFHYFVKPNFGNDRSTKEVSEKYFVQLLSTEYCGHVSACGSIGIVTPDEDKALKLVRSMKRGRTDTQIISCADYTLTFRKDAAPSKKGNRDSSTNDRA